MKNATLSKTLCQISLVVAGGMVANAQAVTLKDSGQSLVGNQSNVSLGSSSVNPFGAWQVKDTDVANGGNFWVYCLDPLNATATGLWGGQASTKSIGTGWFTNAATGNSPNTYTDLFNSSKYDAAGLDPQNKSTVVTKLQQLYSGAYADSLTSALKSQAFQYAIWEIESDSGTYSRFDGDAQVNQTPGKTDFEAQVDVYLTALNNNTWSGATATNPYLFTVYVPTGKGQVLIAAEKGTPGNQVPEPSSFALAGLALFGVAYTRRQIKNKR